MTKLYDEVKDVEFMIMGIGDLAYDECPIQASQFESDIRIAEQLDKLYFEFGGGGNNYESYTSAWYFGLRHTKLDCWKRNSRGIIITIGDERLNPYLPVRTLSSTTGDQLQSDVETSDLYKETIEKFDVYHLNVDHRHNYNGEAIKTSFLEYLDLQHFRTVTMDDIADTIVDIVSNATKFDAEKNNSVEVNSNGEISW